jgi:predicted TIM-barrel fold metal-dependent hydrolase
MIGPYQTYPELSGAMWGYAAEAGLHAMRLICSGVFDTYPKLKIILGHLGEGLLYWLWRMDSRSSGLQARHKPSYYVKNNFFVNTSGMFWPPAIEFACRALGADKVLFAVDYPSESNIDGVQAIRDLAIDSAEKEKIFHLNSEKLFQL